MILHWKIAFTSLKYSFQRNPNSCCFVLVHFQSHNAPNLPPLHISETGYDRAFSDLNNILSLFKTCFIDTQTSKELIQMDINKKMRNGIFTMNGKHTQSEA